MIQPQLKGTSITHFPKLSVDSHALLVFQRRQKRLLMHDVCAFNISANVLVVLHLPADSVSVNHTSQVYQRDTYKFDSQNLCEQ